MRDEAGQIVDFLFEFVNAAHCRDYGKERVEFIGCGIRQMWPGVDARLFDQYRHVCETGEPLNDEVYYCDEKPATRHMTGIWAREVRYIDGCLVICARNVTRQKAHEEHLTGWNGRLEDEVELRTHQLQAMNTALEKEMMERQAAQEALRQYKLFFVRSRDVMLFINQATERIVEANPAAVAAYGYSYEELLRLKIVDLRLKDSPQLITGQLRQAANGGITFETEHRRKDGSTFFVEVNSIGEQIGPQKLLFSVVRDITERRRFAGRNSDAGGNCRANAAVFAAGRFSG